MRKTVIKRRKRVSGANAPAAANNSNATFAGPSSTAGASTHREREPDIEEEAASTVAGSVGGASTAYRDPKSSHVPGAPGPNTQSDQAHEAAMTLIAVHTSGGPGGSEPAAPQRGPADGARPHHHHHHHHHPLPAGASAGGREKVRAQVAAAGAGQQRSLVADGEADDRPSKRAKPSPKDARAKDATVARPSAKETPHKPPPPPSSVASASSSAVPHHHHHHHHRHIPAAAHTHAHAHAHAPHAHSASSEHVHAVPPQQWLAEVVQHHLELVEEKRRLDVLLRKTETVLASAGIALPLPPAGVHHHHHTPHGIVPHVHHHHHPPGVHTHGQHGHAHVHRVHSHSHLPVQAGPDPSSPARARQAIAAAPGTSGEAGPPSRLQERDQRSSSPKGPAGQEGEGSGNAAAKHPADTAERSPDRPTDPDAVKSDGAAGDFEARIAAMPVSAAVPLPHKRKSGLTGGGAGGEDSLSARGRSSEASSAISGWLKGVAESSASASAAASAAPSVHSDAEPEHEHEHEHEPVAAPDHEGVTKRDNGNDAGAEAQMDA